MITKKDAVVLEPVDVTLAAPPAPPVAADVNGLASLMQILGPLLQLAQAELSDRQDKKNKELDDLKRLLNARTEGFKQEIARKRLIQSSCNHMKERGQGSRIVGQKLSNGHVHYVCQYCTAEFDETTLPAILHIPFEFIGG